MDLLLMLRQALLFGHALAFAIAIGAVLRTDLVLLHARTIDVQHIEATAHLLVRVLAALWLSGLALVALSAVAQGDHFSLGAKLSAKLIVVTALTLNGCLLHAWALPMLRRDGAGGPGHAQRDALLMMGAVSTASWIYASFVGVSRLIAPIWSLSDYLAGYGVVLVFALAVTMHFVRPRLAFQPPAA